jgi:hypothetical protein
MMTEIFCGKIISVQKKPIFNWMMKMALNLINQMYWSWNDHNVYLSLFILATGSPYGWVLRKSILEDSARYRMIQNLDAPFPEASPSSLTCQVFQHSYTGPSFKVSSERLISNFSWTAWKSNPQCWEYKSRARTD